MPRKSPKRVLAEKVLSDPSSSAADKLAADTIIRELDKRSAYMIAYDRRRRENDPDFRERRRISKVKWKRSNPDKIYAGVRRHHRKRYREDPQFRIEMLMRAMVHRGVRGGQKTSKYIQHLDWSIADLKAHIEAQFAPDMTWENLGSVWEIDHVEPRATFNYDSFEHPEFVRCWRRANLKPTYKQENREQGYSLAYRK